MKLIGRLDRGQASLDRDGTGAAASPTARGYESETVLGEESFQVSIRRGDADAEAGAESAEPNTEAITAALSEGAESAPEAEEGAVVELPPLYMPETMGAQEQDSVAGSLAYSPSVNQSGAVDPFGATDWGTFNITGIKVKASGAAFTVHATVQNPITFNVNAGGRINIPSNNAAALNGLGWIAKGQDKADEAIGFWEKAVKASPEATAALRGLAITHMERKEYEQASTYFHKWLLEEPKNTEAEEGMIKAIAKLGMTSRPAAASAPHRPTGR